MSASRTEKNPNARKSKPLQINKIYDSDEEIESLSDGDEDWNKDNQTPDLFYKDNHNSNANTNAQDNEDHSDVLSDFIVPA